MRDCITPTCTNPTVSGGDFCLYCLGGDGTRFQGASGPSRESVQDAVERPSAGDFLLKAAGHMDDRAATYDAPEGERSMAKTVAAFNVLTGRNLSETEGWTFMELLKIARSFQGEFKQDNYEDRVAYAALAGEAAVKEA